MTPTRASLLDTGAEQLALDWSSPSDTAKAVPLIARAKHRPAPRKPPAPRRLAVVEPIAPEPLTDRRGLPRTEATSPGWRKGVAPLSKGRRYPPDPPTAEDINAMLAVLARPISKHENRIGALSRRRLAATIIVLWRTGCRIAEFLDLENRDLSRDEKCITIRSGKGDRRRLVMMDDWGWKALDAWTDLRKQIPAGPVFCVVSGVTAGQSWSSADVRRQLKRTATTAGVTRRIAPHQFRHAHAVGLYREKIDAFAIQKQLGHARLDMLMVYLASLTPIDVLAPIGARPAPVMQLQH